jgi:3-methyladenine DNA glycosylase AlkD
MLKRIQARFQELRDAEFAAGQQRFFQHEVDTYGVRTTQLHAMEREVWRELKHWPAAPRDELVELLWRDRKIESGALACYLYRRLGKQCGRAEFQRFEMWLDKYVRNWAHCDGVSSWLLAACIRNEPDLRFQLTAWTSSGNRWKRRAAAVALLGAAHSGQHTDFILDIASRLLPDRDDMVEKGVGWLLKEAYPKKPRETVAFLVENGTQASRLTLRYAAEKMTPTDRRRVLGP